MRGSTKNVEIKWMMKILKKSTKVVIPTNNTNSFRVVELKDYLQWVKGHIQKNALLTTRDRIVEIYKEAKYLMKRLEDKVSKSEFLFVLEKI